MSDRRRKHDWYLALIWGERIPRCAACGLIGQYEVTLGRNAIGWKGSPTFGCEPASVDTHPEGGDALAAPFMSGAVGASRDAQPPHPSSETPPC